MTGRRDVGGCVFALLVGMTGCGTKSVGFDYTSDIGKKYCEAQPLRVMDDAVTLSGEAREQRIAKNCRVAGCVAELMASRIESLGMQPEAALGGCVATYERGDIVAIKVECRLSRAPLVGTKFENCDATYQVTITSVDDFVELGYRYEFSSGQGFLHYQCDNGSTFSSKASAQVPHAVRLQEIDHAIETTFDQLCLLE